MDSNFNNLKIETPKEFAGRLMGITNAGCQALALSMGTDLGIFEAMAKLQGPRTSSEIAKAAGLKERYLREWLSEMVVSKIVDMDPIKGTYVVPPHRLPFLTGEHNMAGMLNMMPMMYEVYDKVMSCFRKEGPRGLSYSHYSRFHECMDCISHMLRKKSLVPDVVSIPGMKEKLEKGINVLDVACGCASAPMILAENFPKSSFHALDFSEEAVKFAQNAAAKKGLTNITFVLCDAANMPRDWNDKFDYITAMDCIHDQAYPSKVLVEILRVLAPGGVFSMFEIGVYSTPTENIGNPRAVDGYVISMMHCIPVSLYFEGGAGLGINYGKEKAIDLLTSNGFAEITTKKSTDTFNWHFIAKKVSSGN